MTLARRRFSQQPEEYVSQKQRETLAKRKDELMREIDDLLSQMPDSFEKQELIEKRDHCVAKFPVFPVDLSTWIIAYHEDWMRAYNRATAT